MNMKYLFLIMATLIMASAASAQYYFYAYNTYYGNAWNGGYYDTYYNGYYYYGYPTYYGTTYYNGSYDCDYTASTGFYSSAYSTSYYICDTIGCFYWYYADPFCYGPYCYDYYYWNYPYYGNPVCSPGYKCIDPDTQAYQLSNCNILPETEEDCLYGCDRETGRCRTQPEVSCNDLMLVTHSVFMDAGETTIESFYLQNNNPWYNFTLDNAYTNEDITDEDKINAEIEDFDSTAITYGGRADIDVEIEAYPRETYTSAEAYLRARGHFNDPSRLECDIGDIGTKNYMVYIDGVEDNTAHCSNVYMTVHNVYLEAGESSLETFTIYNNNAHRYFIDNMRIEQFDPEFNAEIVYQDSYVDAGQTGRIEVLFDAGNVGADFNGDIAIRFEGHYDNGQECSYNSMGDYYVNVYINYTPGPMPLSCEDITLRAENQYVDPDQTIHPIMIVENNNTIPFTIESVNAYDYDQEFDTQAYNVIDQVIQGQSDGQIQLRIHGNYSGSGTAYYEVAGYYADGTRCSYNSIQRAAYEVYVDSAPIDYCRQINIATRTIRMGTNATEYPIFKTENNSNKIFYIDRLYAYDYDMDVEVEEYVFEDKIYPNASGDIKVKVSSAADTDGEATGYVELSGHFADGSTCSNTYKAFDILLDQGLAPSDAYLAKPTCKGYSLSVPSSMIIAGDKTKSISVYAENKTSNNILVRVVSSANLRVTPESFTISPGLNTKHFIVSALGAGEGWLNFESELSDCQYSPKYTKVFVEASAMQTTTTSYTPMAQPTQPVIPSPTTQNTPGTSAVDLIVETTINTTSEGAEINATIRNNSSQDFLGTVQLNLGAGWIIEGSNDILVKSGSSKTIAITVKAPEGTEGSTTTKLEVVDNQGNAMAEQDIIIPEPSTGMLAAMASLAANPLDLALIIVLMFLLVAIIVRMMK